MKNPGKSCGRCAAGGALLALLLTPLAHAAQLPRLNLAGLARGGSAPAANPKLTLRLENVTALEAAAALGKAAGLAIEVPGAKAAAGAQPAGLDRLNERTSFDWNGYSFVRALRQLCERYQLRASRNDTAYYLYPLTDPPGRQGKLFGLVVKNGVQLYPTSVSASFQRSLNLQQDNPAGNDSASLNVQINGRLEDGDAETIAGFDNITARDDLGNVLVGNSSFSVYSRSFGGYGMPDEWNDYVNLNGIHPRARKLVWLEADLLGYKEYLRHEVELPIPIPEGGIRKQVGDVDFELVKADRDEKNKTLAIRMRVASPSDGPLAYERGLNAPTLIGASGKAYRSYSGSNGGSSQDGRMIREMNFRYQAVDEPVSKLVFRWAEKGEPQRLFTFRMTDIPLPAETLPAARSAVNPPRRIVGTPMLAPPPERPFLEKDGGILVSPIRVLGAPAEKGTLAVGLSPRDGDDWGPIRWQEVEVGSGGVSRLPDLKPGTYRLLRIYRSPKPLRVDAHGRWQNTEVEVVFTGGKEAAVPPLEWVIEVPSSTSSTPAPKAAGPKPPAGKAVPKRAN